MVRIVGAPGFDDFDAVVVSGLGNVERDHGEGVAVVVDLSDGGVYVVPARCVVEGE